MSWFGAAMEPGIRIEAETMWDIPLDMPCDMPFDMPCDIESCR